MIETYQAFLKDEIDKQIERIYNAIEPEYSKLGTLSILRDPSKKGNHPAFVSIRAHRKPDEPLYPPYDDLDGELSASLKDDYSFFLYADISLTSGVVYQEIAFKEMCLKRETDPRKTIHDVLEAAGDKMIEAFHNLLPEINGNLGQWITERQSKD